MLMAMTNDSIQITSAPFDPSRETEQVRAGDPGIGAVVSFLGLMRDINLGEGVAGMTLEHYPGMTEKALAAIVAEARERWELQAVRVVHRVGELQPEDPIVLVAVASAHRAEAFQACEFIIDYLKNRAPFWKKEVTPTGPRWVEARDTDRQAEERWQQG